jgi:uncharacterized Zn-finger protein
MSVDGEKIKVVIHRSDSEGPVSKDVTAKTEVVKVVKKSKRALSKTPVILSGPIPRTRYPKKKSRSDIQCEVCSKILQAKNLKTHMLIHSGEKPFKCKTCNREFRHQSSLANHINQHLEVKPFMCKHCKKPMTSERSLKLHIEFHCPWNAVKRQPENRQLCEFCSKTFVTKSILSRHIKECHKKDQPFHCDFCNRGFSRKDDLKKHMWLHTGEMPSTCDICEKRFRLQSNMMQHRRRHSICSKPLICDLCGLKFPTLSKLNKHKEDHTNPDLVSEIFESDTLPTTVKAAETLQLLAGSGPQDMENTTVTVSTIEIGPEGALSNSQEIILHAESGVRIVQAYLVPVTQADPEPANDQQV